MISEWSRYRSACSTGSTDPDGSNRSLCSGDAGDDAAFCRTPAGPLQSGDVGHCIDTPSALGAGIRAATIVGGAGAIDEPAGTRHPCAVALSIASLPRYLFTGRFFQVVRHLPNFARLYWRLFRDRRVPVLPKALLVLTLVYVVSPLDGIPDFIPVIGEMDDVVLVLSGLWLFIRLCPSEVVRETVHEIATRAEARG